VGTPGFPDLPGLTEAGIGKTRDASGSWLHASTITDDTDRWLRLWRPSAHSHGDLLDSAAALRLLHWLCTVLYQPHQHGQWRLRLLPCRAGWSPGVFVDRPVAFWLLDCVCEFLYQPPATEPGTGSWFQDGDSP